MRPSFLTCTKTRSFLISNCYRRLIHATCNAPGQYSEKSKVLELKWDNKSHIYVPSYRFSDAHKLPNSNEIVEMLTSNDGFDNMTTNKRLERARQPSVLLRESNENLFSANDVLVQRFLTALEASDFRTATFILESMIKDGFYRYHFTIQENCFILLLHYSIEAMNSLKHKPAMGYLNTVGDLLQVYHSALKKFDQQDSYPYKAMAFIFHNACKIVDYHERVNTILRLEYLWSREFNLELGPVLEQSEMLTETDKQMINLMLSVNKRENVTIQSLLNESVSADDFLSKFNWRTSIGQSLDEILQNKSFDVKSLFGDDVLQESLVDGNLNYLKLYNTLYRHSNYDTSSPLLMKFERLFDSFNRQRQYDLEMKFRDFSIQRAEVKTELSSSSTKSKRFLGPSNFSLQRYISEWSEKLKDEIGRQLRRITHTQRVTSSEESQTDTTKDEYLEDKYPRQHLIIKELKKNRHILANLGAKKIADIVTLELSSILFGTLTRSDENDGKFKRTVAQISRSIGESIENAEAQIRLKEVVRNLGLSGTHGDNNNSDPVDLNVAKLAHAFSSSHPKRREISTRQYSKMMGLDYIGLGATLITLALENFRFSQIDSSTGQEVFMPAFKHEMEVRTNKLVGVIRPTHEFVVKVARVPKTLKQDVLTPLTLSKVPPMLVKPKPWDASLGGGYWYNNLPTLGGKPEEVPEQYSYVINAIKHNHMDKFMDSLNGLSNCAWAVNPYMLNVLLSIWETGNDFLSIPGESEIPPEDLKKNSTDFYKYSDRLSLEYILRSAEIFGRNGDRFYYPHRIDFRGRVYPLSSSAFWHLGPDHVRSLFMFWYGKPLGKSGLKWLKIHLANMYGVDKINREDQVKFVDSHWNEISQSAKDPLGNSKENRWWTEGDKPFQTLAACFELTAAIESENPETFVSRLCIAQDGTCNGLQHYAALGRDIRGATEVNLLPQAEVEPGVRAPPRDIYGKVRDVVADLVENDSNSKDSKGTLAEELRGHITRKVVKRPVMTSVYGVTRYGTIKQVEDELKQNPALDHDQIKKYRVYIADKIFEAYGTLFGNAEMIQHWLEDCASRICMSVRWDNYGSYQEADEYFASQKKPGKVASDSRLASLIVKDKDFLSKYMTSIVWTTPLGLPVVQPYRKMETLEVHTSLQRITVYNPYRPAFVVKPKQVNGIAPNYIHSLDATHLHMTSSAMSRRGLTFASVHDSYWTHAADVDALSSILREKFVELHRPNLIVELYNEWKLRYDGYLQVVYVRRKSEAGKRIQRLRDVHESEVVQLVKKKAKAQGIHDESSSDGQDKSSFQRRTETQILRYEMLLEYRNWTKFQNQEHPGEVESSFDETPSQIISELQEPVYLNPHNGIIYGDATTCKSNSETGKTDGSSEKKNYRPPNQQDWLKVFVPIHIPKPPERGEFDIELVKQSEYFFK